MIGHHLVLRIAFVLAVALGVGCATGPTCPAVIRSGTFSGALSAAPAAVLTNVRVSVALEEYGRRDEPRPLGAYWRLDPSDALPGATATVDTLGARDALLVLGALGLPPTATSPLSAAGWAALQYFVYGRRSSHPSIRKSLWRRALGLPGRHPIHAGVTADLHVAESFTRLRASAGAGYQDRAVKDPQRVRCDLEYSYNSTMENGAVFKAAEMEDKWDIYLYSPYLYFARSWTGDLQYRATLSPEPGRVRVTEVECPGDTDPEFARRAVDYLIRSHLFRALLPHPLPATLPEEPEPIAAISFSLFGRRCSYGSFADTTILRPAAPLS